MTKDDYNKIKSIDNKIRTMDVYMASKDLDIIDDIKNNIKKDKLILATTDSKNVIDLFDDDLDVVKMLNVPVTAIKKYMETPVDDVDSIEDFKFKDVDTDDEEELYELSTFSDSTIFLLDLYPYIKDIEIKIDKSDDDDDDFDELKTESKNTFASYYMDGDAGRLITEMPHLKIGNELYDFYMENNGWDERLIKIIKSKKHNVVDILEPFYGIYKIMFLKRFGDLNNLEQERLKKYLPVKFKLDMRI